MEAGQDILMRCEYTVEYLERPIEIVSRFLQSGQARGAIETSRKPSK